MCAATVPAVSIVCIDVNPGRRGGWGSLGLVEVVDDQVATRLDIVWEQPAGFAVEWLFAEAFIADRPLVAYGADYDLHALCRLLAAADLPVPDLRLSDAMLAVMDAVPFGSYDLQGLSRDLPLYSPAELDVLRARSRELGAEKWLLSTAADDAEACARAWLYVARLWSLSAVELVAQRPSRALRVGAPH